MNFNFKVTDFFILPTSVYLAIGVASGFVLFLPDDWLRKIYLFTMREDFGSVIGMVLIFSFSIVIIRSIKIGYRLFQYKRLTSKRRLKELDDYEKALVSYLFIHWNRTADLPLKDGSVKKLESKMVITRTVNSYGTNDLNNVEFPFVLNDWAVRLLENDDSLQKEFFEITNKYVNEGCLNIKKTID